MSEILILRASAPKLYVSWKVLQLFCPEKELVSLKDINFYGKLSDRYLKNTHPFAEFSHGYCPH